MIDTPGLRSGREDAEYERERRRASDLTLPGPHALLYVVRHQHVTDEDLAGFRSLARHLGQGLSHHTVVVLVGAPTTTHPGAPAHLLPPPQEGSELEPGAAAPATSPHPLAAPQPVDGDPSSSSFSSPCSSSSSSSPSSSVSELPGGVVSHDEGSVFSALLQEAGGKLWVVDNLEKEDASARNGQVNALVKMVYGILDNSGGNCFHGDQVAKEAAKGRKAKDKDKDKDGARRGSSCWFL